MWTPIELPQQLPLIGTSEDALLDFKREGYGNSDAQRVEIARDVAQFANHLGGTIILGAEEDQNAQLASYVNLQDVEVQRIRIADITAALLAPRITVTTTAIQHGGLGVLAINVAPSARMVGSRISGTDRWEFPKRNGRQRMFLRYDEVQSMDTVERRVFLMLDGIPYESRDRIRLDADLMHLKEHGWHLEQVQQYHVELKSSDGVCAYVPLAFVESVWPSDGNGQYTISASCALTMNQSRNGIIVQQRRRG